MAFRPGHRLQPPAAQCTEIVKQPRQLLPCKIVSLRVRNYRPAPRTCNASNRSIQSHPLRGYVCGATRSKQSVKCRLNTACTACFQEEFRKVSTTGRGVAGALPASSPGAFDSEVFQPVRNFNAPFPSSVLLLIERHDEILVMLIDTYADDVNLVTLPDRRNLNACKQPDTSDFGGGTRLGYAAHRIMVRKCKKVHAHCRRARHNRSWRQCTVGCG